MSKGTAVTGWYFHTGFNLIASSLIGGIVCLNYGEAVFYPLFIAMVFGTIFMNPDIDSNRSRTYRAWFILRWYWYPYARFMSHSGRSYFPLEVRRGIGHNLFIGTAIRILYASPLFVGINEMVNLNLNNWLMICFGIWLADALHILVDYLFHKNSRG